MSPAEVLGHARRRLRALSDARGERDWARVPLDPVTAFPALPRPDRAPEAVRQSLARDVERILSGRWRAFGEVALRVDDPPRWHFDYLAGVDVATGASAFGLDHRALPGGADIRLVWELSRWHAPVRLAQAAHVLGHERAAEKCVLWLEDWVKRNPPYRGWNWTSALEAGLRLIQFTWIDALLAARAEAWGLDAELATLRYEILPPHAGFAWRHRSFGSSANNHRMGELAGLMVATARWPALAAWGAPLGALQARWEREVLAQFAADGGNREQALSYHLFSWELCWQAWRALQAAGRAVPAPVEDRLRCAADFFLAVQVPEDPWDYGDSDSALACPLVSDEARAVAEWHQWFREPSRSVSLHYWLGGAPWGGLAAVRVSQPCASPWAIHAASGLAMRRCGDWTLRLDGSPLGYLRTAAHGHLDALHLSIWRGGVALVIDPGTGAYFSDPSLRCWLASRSAHNGPCPAGEEYPRRRGPFLWAAQHEPPVLEDGGAAGISVRLRLPDATLQRTVTWRPEAGGWDVVDGCVGRGGGVFSVRWQFAPGSTVERLGERRFRVCRAGAAMEVQVGVGWAEVFLVTDKAQVVQADPGGLLAGTVSPGFRRTVWASYVKLVGRMGDKPCVFRTTFLGSPPA